MKLLRRVLERIDNRCAQALDRHLTLAELIPDRGSVVPDYIPSVWSKALVPCCGCCATLYRDLPCPEPHFTPCPSGCTPDAA